jgi:hypothetical protein
MSAAIWLIMYDVAAANKARYLDWFHDVHMPEKLARPGYTWAAHYEIITPDGRAAALSSDATGEDKRGFLAVFGGQDTRTFLDPSPAQIKPTQPPLTREMTAMRIASQSLIATEEWRFVSERQESPSYKMLSVTICDVGGNDEDYGAWTTQVLAPHLQEMAGFEVVTKLLSTTSAARHVTISSYGTLPQATTNHPGGFGDEWSGRVAAYQVHATGSPLLARRIQ